MADNLNIKGLIEPDEKPGRRLKTKGKRQKPWIIEVRYPPPPPGRDTGLGWLWKSLAEWHVHGRYETRARRDEAFAALVKKSHVEYPTTWSQAPQYRKVNPDGI